MQIKYYIVAALLAVGTVAQDATAQCCRLFGGCGRRVACCRRASAYASNYSASRYMRASTCSVCVPGFESSTVAEYAPGFGSVAAPCSNAANYCASGACAFGSCANGTCGAPVVAPCDQVETTTETTETETTTEETTGAPVCSPCGRVETTCSGGSCSSYGWTTDRTRGGFLGGLLDVANATRARFGLRGYVLDAQLCREAEATARHCAAIGGLQHTLDGRAEIIAYNYSGFSGAVDQWLASRAGHREALLSSGYTRAGVAIVNAGGRSYCCMRFR